MATQSSGGSATSFTNTPQAQDDTYLWSEDQIFNLQNYNPVNNTIILDVMANDLGGKAKSLFSVEDGDGNPITADYELLAKDVGSTGASAWEKTLLGNWVRINNGKIEYRLSDGSGIPGAGVDINTLSAGETIKDSFVYAIRLGNGTLSEANVSLTLTGANDAAAIGVDTAATGDRVVVEAGATGRGDPDASGTLSVSDVDAGEAMFQAPASLDGVYGSFTFDPATGTWTYTLDNDRAATQALKQGQPVSDTLTVTSLDGTASHAIVVNITGGNDAAAIVVDATVADDRSVSEAGVAGNGDPDASGTLSVSDVDAGEAAFQTPASLDGVYGTFTFDPATGTWTYTLDNERAATQALKQGQPVSDTLTVTSLDGTADHAIVVNIAGGNDAAAIVVDAIAADDRSVSEAGVAGNGDPDASGTLSVSDVDAGEAAFQTPASLDGAYGTFTFDPAIGTWTYTLDNDRAATQALKQGQPVSDTLTVTSLDGTASHAIVVNIAGGNDAAAIVVDTSVVDDRSVSEAGTAGSGDPDASGTLSVSDVDAGEALFQTPASLDGVYGSFTFDPAIGTWTYTLDNDRAATQALKQGQPVSDTLTVTSLDGTASHAIVVNIAGGNDAAAIVVDAIAADDRSVSEAGLAGNGDPDASGTLSVSDVDAGEAVFAAPAALDGVYGSFSFDPATGTWTYTLDNDRAATQSLKQGQPVSDTLTVTSLDGTASHAIVVNITGGNDAAAIVVDATVADDRSVSEAGVAGNGDPDASGTLSVSDVDAGEAAFQTPASLDGVYGTFTFDPATGTWTYTLDNERAATQALKQGQPVSDTLTVTSLDGTADHAIVVNIAGGNDAAAIVVDAIAADDRSVSEAGVAGNGDPDASGTLSVSDVDAGEAAFQTPASLDGVYGTFTFDPATGTWTYTLDNERAATQALKQGQPVSDTLTVTSLDGTADHAIVVNIAGGNDAAAIVVDAIAADDRSVSEAGVAGNGDPDASGTLSVSDVDAGEAAFQTPASLDGVYGTFTFDPATGTWTYTLDNERAATQALKQGQPVSDTLTVTSLDGTADHAIVVNIAGGNDAAAIVVDAIAADDRSVSEAGVAGNGDPDASGTLSVSDVDAGEAAFQTPASLDGAYGTFTFDPAIGTWTYTLDNDRAATQALKQGQPVSDTLTVTSLDGTADHAIVVNITGGNDAAAIVVDTSVVDDRSVSEAGTAGSGDPDASGKLSVSDVDAGEAAFQAPVSLAAIYGSFSFDAATGEWDYILDNERAATQALSAGQAVSDTLTVTSLDGTVNHAIVVDITGADDAPPRQAPVDIKLTPVAPTDDAPNFNGFQFSGSLSATDPDAGAFVFSIASQSHAGLFSISGNTLNSGGLAQNGTFSVTVKATQIGDPTGPAFEKTETFTIITGRNGNNEDTRTGVSGDDVLYGGGGNDTIYGLGGDDSLFGQSGDDTLNGGAGNNVLNGGGGNDTFVFQKLSGTTNHVTDFSAGANNTSVDKLQFDVGSGTFEFAVGNNNTAVDGFKSGSNGTINATGTELAVKTDADVSNATVQSTIDGYGNITTGALFVFYNTDLGHAAVYYDANASVAGGAVLVAELDNITPRNALGSFNFGDFLFV
ncbi:VCBS domain-containing protein [Sinorhizobium fredii]|uniref:VCBS domain-containing protein n=1 Tax=Rhizobium fredii TaxID=380 RepID=UPI003518F9F6